MGHAGTTLSAPDSIKRDVRAGRIVDPVVSPIRLDSQPCIHAFPVFAPDHVLERSLGFLLGYGCLVERFVPFMCRCYDLVLNVVVGRLRCTAPEQSRSKRDVIGKERDVPEYIELDDKNKTAKLVRVPKFSEVPFPVIMEPSLVIEYYSR